MLGGACIIRNVEGERGIEVTNGNAYYTNANAHFCVSTENGTVLTVTMIGTNPA